MSRPWRAPAWSPYTTGILIGLLQIPAFLLMQTALGASSSYVTVSGHAAVLVNPDLLQLDYLAKHLDGAKNWWQVAMVIGIALGAWLSSTLSGQRRHGHAPVWTRVLGSTPVLPRPAMAFLGGFVMLVGARIADGCTSGHGISGIAQLAIGSFIAVTCMFVGGIATAMLLRKI